MAANTTGSSGKTNPPFSKDVMARFDGMLDLISEKNAMIGRLITELAEAKEHFETLIPIEMEPTYKRAIRLRIGAIDRRVKEALA